MKAIIAIVLVAGAALFTILDTVQHTVETVLIKPMTQSIKQ